jgi:hypothetical protein
MPYKDPEKRREVSIKSCRKYYAAHAEEVKQKKRERYHKQKVIKDAFKELVQLEAIYVE